MQTLRPWLKQGSRVLVLVLLAGCLTGCQDAMILFQREVWGADCRPEKMDNGRCVAYKPEGSPQ